MDKAVNMMSVDVEDYFQVSAFENTINRADWDSYQCRVAENTNRILELFAAYNAKATFFVLGWVAERYPELVKRIVNEGHELASHGYDHKRVTSLDAKTFKEDLVKSKDILENISGVRVRGYRAPSYSIITENLWAHRILAECEFEYSSSIYPIKHDHYGIPDAPRFKYNTDYDGLIEFPISTVRKFGRNFPGGGGGFFRLYPYWLTKYGINDINQHDGQAVIFYFHPWEIDPGQPKVPGISLKTRFRHYLNLDKTEQKLKRLLQDYEWKAICNNI